MRPAIASVVALLVLAASAFAQEYVEFKSMQDRFSIVFPAQPKACPPGAEACAGNTGAGSSTGAGYWKPDIEGAVIHATWELMQRPNEKAIYLGWANMNLVEGHMVNLVNEKDKSRTSAAIYMHEDKLYIIEGTVPAGYPVPDFFQQSVGWLDDKGNDIRYLTIYHNGFPKPEVRTQGGGNAGRGGRGNQ